MAKSVPAARLSIELVAEIARLQTDLDRAKKMVAAASGDIAKSTKGANDNLKAIGAGGSPGLQQFSRDVAAFKSKIDPAFGALQQYRQEVALLQKALAEGAISHKTFVEQMRSAVSVYKNAGVEVEGAHKRMGASGMIAEHVVRAMSDSIAAGQSPVRALTMEMGRITEAVTFFAMETGKTTGVFGKFLGFMRGPWAIVVSAAIAVFGPFIADLFKGAEGSKEHEKALKAEAKAIAELDDITGRGNKTLEQRIRLGVEATKVALAQAMATRKQLAAELATLSLTASGGRAQNYGANYASDVKLTNGGIQARIAANNAAIAENEQRIRSVARLAIMKQVAGATDKIEAATQKYNSALIQLNQEYDRGGVANGEYYRRLKTITEQLKAVKDADKNAALAKREHNAALREHNKELREAAKAARDAAKAQKEYEKTVMGGAALRKLNNMGPILTSKEINASVQASAMALQAELDKRNQARENAAAFERDQQRLRDEESRKRAIDAANNVADIVGGRIGQAIAELANALDRFSALLADKNGTVSKGFAKISKGLGDTLAAAGAGAQVGAATASIMKGLGIKTSSTGAELGGAHRGQRPSARSARSPAASSAASSAACSRRSRRRAPPSRSRRARRCGRRLTGNSSKLTKAVAGRDGGQPDRVA
jgi:hypothetical protein